MATLPRTGHSRRLTSEAAPIRLVFIHGIHEDHKQPLALRRKWQHALHAAWDAAGLAKPHYTLEMPYYGDLLAQLAEPPAPVAPPASACQIHLPHAISKTGHKILHDVGKRLCVNQKKFANQIVRSNVAGSAFVQTLLSTLDSDMPGFSPFLLRFVRQVDAYLKMAKVRRAVDDIIRPTLVGGPAIVVAHSLGSVIAYRLLRRAQKDAEVPLLVTLGSPLGICTIKEHLCPPALAFPPAVKTWLNATDARDCVAFHARLDHETFVDGIENVVSVKHRRANPHDIRDYLANKTVARCIHTALTHGTGVTRRVSYVARRVRVVSAKTAAPRHKTRG